MNGTYAGLARVLAKEKIRDIGCVNGMREWCNIEYRRGVRHE